MCTICEIGPSSTGAQMSLQDDAVAGSALSKEHLFNHAVRVKLCSNVPFQFTTGKDAFTPIKFSREMLRNRINLTPLNILIIW